MILSLMVYLLSVGAPSAEAQPIKRSKPNSIEDVKAQQVQETGGCKKLNGVKSDLELDFLTTSRAFFSSLPLEFWVVPDQTTCFKNNQMHRVVMAETKQVLGEVKVTLVVTPTTLSMLKDDAPLVIPLFPALKNYLKDVDPIMKLYYPEVKPDDLIMGLSLGPIKKSDNWLNVFTSVMPRNHRVAKVVTAAEVTKMMAEDKPYILDTRHEFFFKVWHLPNAQQHYLKPELKFSGESRDYMQLNVLKDNIRLKDLPKDPNTKILIMGHSFLDQGPFYTAYYLKLAGYKNLYYYRGGQEESKTTLRLLPDGKAPGDVPVAAWKDVETKLGGYQLVDTRPQKEYDLWHVKGAVSAPYLSSRVPPPTTESFKKETFEGDEWNTAGLPKDKSKPLLIIGRDEADWAAVVATRHAIKLGYKATWYKGGVAEWRSLAYWYRGRFPLEGKGELPSKAVAQAN